MPRRREPPKSTDWTPELKAALESFEQGALDRVVRRKRMEDYTALRQLAASPTADPNLRQRAIQALGRWGDSAAVADIVAFLVAPETTESHRITAIEALGRLGTQKAREAVTAFAEHESPDVRKFVVRALGSIGDAPARATLRRLAKSEKADWIRELAAKRASSKAPGRR